MKIKSHGTCTNVQIRTNILTRNAQKFYKILLKYTNV